MARFSRRSLLRAAGAALPWLPGAIRRAMAGDPVAPRRVIFVYLPNNDVDEMMPRGTGRSFSLDGTYLAPLAPFARKLMVVTGVKGNGGHNAGHSEWLTGWPNHGYGANDNVPTHGPSLDQYLGGRLGTATRLPTLGLTLANLPVDAGQIVSYTAGLLAVPSMRDPLQGFQRVFGQMAGGSTPAMPSREAMLKSSVLDALRQNFERSSAALGTAERQLLDQHLTLLRDQERRLQLDMQPAFSCSAPMAPPSIPAIASPDYPDPTRPQVIRHHIDTIVGALRCDATRVVTLAFGGTGDRTPNPWANADEDFHQIAHRDVNNAHAYHVSVRTWQAQQIAYLCAQLDAVPEAGGTLLDHTVVAWLPELGYCPYTEPHDSTHSRDTITVALVGGAGYFDVGQVLDVAGAHYHRLLLTFAHAMGYEDLTTLGESGNSPIAQLRRGP
jgi:hypothetical protein